MKRQRRFFVFFFLLIGVFPLVVHAQTPPQKVRIETYTVNLKTSSDAKLDASLHTGDSTFLLTLMGSGVGTGSIDANDEAILFLDNDSTVKVTSIGFQGIESKNFVNTYQHEYAISLKSLEVLSRHNLRRVRKYALAEYKDIYLDEPGSGNLKALCVYFLQELSKANLLRPKPVAGLPAFPGGRDVFLSFLNRNLKLQQPFAEGKKEASVQFQVAADGSISEFRIVQSAGAPYDEELLRILKRMPRWKPALAEGKQVAATVSQEVTFLRQDSLMQIQLR